MAKVSETGEARPRRWWQAALERLGLGLFGLLCAVLLAEIALRLATPLLPLSTQIVLKKVPLNPFSSPAVSAPPLFKADTTYGKITLPDPSNSAQVITPGVAIHVTAINWINPEDRLAFRVPSADWQPRWPVDALIVGDSNSFCITEYEDCWVQRLSSDDGLSVVNLGTPGTGSISHQRLLETYGLSQEPRFVIWQWTSNDPNDDYGLNGGLKAVVPFVNPRDSKTALERWLAKNSAIFALYDDIRATDRIVKANPFYYESKQITDDDLSLSVGTPFGFEVTRLDTPTNQAGFELSKQAILASRDLLRQRSIPMVIVLFPSKEEVYRRWTEPVLGKAWLDTVSEARAKTLEFCRAEGIPCLDTTLALTAHADKKEQVYWPLDTHLNPAGNRIVAEAIWNFLVENKLVASR